MPAEAPVFPEDVPEEEAAALLEKVADSIVRRRLSAPALFSLEMCRPLNFVGSQAMIALQPFVSAFVDATSYRKLALVLERDRNLDALMARIAALESEHRAEARTASGARAGLGTRIRGLLTRIRGANGSE